MPGCGLVDLLWSDVIVFEGFGLRRRGAATVRFISIGRFENGPPPVWRLNVQLVGGLLVVHVQAMANLALSVTAGVLRGLVAVASPVGCGSIIVHVNVVSSTK